MLRTTLLSLTAATAIIAAGAARAQDADIVDTAVAAGDFTTLAAALDAAGLAQTLKGEGPFTVFAPTDAAFEALPEGTVETLLMPENKDDLVKILTMHVSPGATMSSDLGDGMMVPTVEGTELAVSIMDGTVKVEDATVTQPDVEASNGVIHVIDAVILPEGM